MSNQRTNIPKQAPLAMFQAHKARTEAYVVTLTGVWIQAPNVIVPPGAEVGMMPGGNGVAGAGVVEWSIGYSESPNSGSMLQTTLSPLPFTVGNLNELWLRSLNASDAVTITISVPGVG